MKLTIYGKPQPKERPRVIRGHAYTPTKTAQYEVRMAREWAAKYPEQAEGDLYVKMLFLMPIPTSWSRSKKELAERGMIRPSLRPDIDNLVKIVLDGLNGVAYLDDKQVVEIFASKAYSKEPRTEVVIEEV